MRRFILTAVLTLALAGPALADPPPAPSAAPPVLPRLFLSPSGEPFRASPAEPDALRAWFEQADAAHVGYLDRAAFRADAARVFKKLDENGDGVIDGFELSDYEKSLPELADQAEGFPTAGAPGARAGGGQGGGGQGGPGGGHGGHRGGGQGGGQNPGQDSSGGAQPPAAAAQRGRQSLFVQLLDEPEPVADADYNIDSHITMDEWMRAADQRFDLLDTRHDGRLTLDELRARLPKPPAKPTSH